MNILQRILVAFIRIYQCTVSPLLGLLCGPLSGCRYTPSCSRYAQEALRSHGICRGAYLSINRVCRCHPWGGAGYDPVPASQSHTATFDPESIHGS